MADLIAQGYEPDDRWRKKVPPGEPFIVGRTAGAWAVPWDERISRKHLELTYRDGRLSVQLLPQARNPVFYRGRKTPEFELGLGEHFVIGGTTFTFSSDALEVSLQAPPPDSERTFRPEELQQQAFLRSDERIESLSRLPALIQSASDDEELLAGLIRLLLDGIRPASGAAVVAWDSRRDALEVLHWDLPRSQGTGFVPSERLIRRALDQQSGVLHFWSTNASAESARFTAEAGIDWAACIPLLADEHEQLVIYLAGKFSNDNVARQTELEEEMKFAELAATTFRNLRDVQRLTRRQGVLAQFLSPPVLNYIRYEDPDEVLAPREVDVSVLFCDLRGFSLEAERLADHLPELLDRVSESLGTMSRHILAGGGVIGDFHGDAAMGFWGWPIATSDAAWRACEAALAIRREFIARGESKSTSANELRVGIGIATGRAIAGKIGTSEQVKVTVLGPVVNVAARLEKLTRTVQAPILIDGPTATSVKDHSSDQSLRLRRVALMKPVGMSSIVDVHELLPTTTELPELTSDSLDRYAQAWAAFQKGEWRLAEQQLDAVDATDRVRQFLAEYVKRHANNPPDNWNGVIEF